MPTGKKKRAPIRFGTQKGRPEGPKPEERPEGKLLEWMQETSRAIKGTPTLRPLWFKEWARMFQKIADGGSGIEAVISAPPRHGKSQLIFHALIYIALSIPNTRLAYVTYNDSFAGKQQITAADILKNLNIYSPGRAHARGKVRERGGVWYFGNGSQIWFTSYQGDLTGEGFNLIVVDDIIKDDASLITQKQRDDLETWFFKTPYTRLQPDRSSIMVIGARWHPDDLSGRLIKQGWKHIHYPAIRDDDGHRIPLAPKLVNRQALSRIESAVGPIRFACMYVGEPRIKGAEVFLQDSISFFRADPPLDSVAIGLDLAYSRGRHSDFCVVSVMSKSNDGTYYILDVIREKMEGHKFLNLHVAPLLNRYPVTPHMFTNGPEKGILEQWSHETGIRLKLTNTSRDKYSRAAGLSAVWNAGKVRIPFEASFNKILLEELSVFTGTTGDRHDDQVDALAAAFAMLPKGRSGKIHYLDHMIVPF